MQPSLPDPVVAGQDVQLVWDLNNAGPSSCSDLTLTLPVIVGYRLLSVTVGTLPAGNSSPDDTEESWGPHHWPDTWVIRAGSLGSGESTQVAATFSVSPEVADGPQQFGAELSGTNRWPPRTRTAPSPSSGRPGSGRPRPKPPPRARPASQCPTSGPSRTTAPRPPRSSSPQPSTARRPRSLSRPIRRTAPPSPPNPRHRSHLEAHRAHGSPLTRLHRANQRHRRPDRHLHPAHREPGTHHTGRRLPHECHPATHSPLRGGRPAPPRRPTALGSTRSDACGEGLVQRRLPGPHLPNGRTNKIGHPSCDTRQSLPPSGFGTACAGTRQCSGGDDGPDAQGA